MTDFEKQIDAAIVKWYKAEYILLSDYFDNPKWDELYNEQKQIAARLFWEEMLS